MPSEWKVVRQQIKSFKNYVNGLSATAKAGAMLSHVITKEDIDTLLNQRGNGAALAGIRIYFGAEIINGEMVPKLYAVASDLVNNSYDDYGVPINGIDLETASPAASTAAMPLKANVLPCPNFCPTSNVLNS